MTEASSRANHPTNWRQSPKAMAKCAVCLQAGQQEDPLVEWKSTVAHLGCAADIEYEALKDAELENT